MKDRKSIGVETIVDMYLPTPNTNTITQSPFPSASEEKTALRVNTECDLPPPYTPSPEETRRTSRNIITSLTERLRSPRIPTLQDTQSSNKPGRFPVKPNQLPKLQITAVDTITFESRPMSKSPGCLY